MYVTTLTNITKQNTNNTCESKFTPIVMTWKVLCEKLYYLKNEHNGYKWMTVLTNVGSRAYKSYNNALIKVYTKWHNTNLHYLHLLDVHDEMHMIQMMMQIEDEKCYLIPNAIPIKFRSSSNSRRISSLLYLHVLNDEL